MLDPQTKQQHVSQWVGRKLFKTQLQLKPHTSTTDGKVSADAGDVFCTPKNKETFYRQLNILKYIRTCHRVSRLRSAVITNTMYGNIARNWLLNDERSFELYNNRPICDERVPTEPITVIIAPMFCSDVKCWFVNYNHFLWRTCDFRHFWKYIRLKWMEYNRLQNRNLCKIIHQVQSFQFLSSYNSNCWMQSL